MTKREVATPQCRSLPRRCSTSRAGARFRSVATPYSRHPTSLRDPPTHRNNPENPSITHIQANRLPHPALASRPTSPAVPLKSP